MRAFGKGILNGFVIYLIFLLNSCSQEGEVGPRGLQGTQILNGNNPPTVAIGLEGDYYLDNSSGDLYGPKSTVGWGDPIHLKGANGTAGSQGSKGDKGDPGLAGNKILSGAGVPAVTLGNVGDFYINRSTSDFYGPKLASGWGGFINLKGSSGTAIHSGTAAPTNTIGVNGDFYLNRNTGQLYGPKTSTGWGTALSLVGPRGANGTNGTDGADGLNGATILSGTVVPSLAQGKVGDFYFRSNTGDFYGPKTATSWGSPFNMKGANGTNGAPGTQILSGTTVPSLQLGNIGDFYFRTTNSDFYGPKTATSWGTPISLKGTTGATGSAGAAGSKILVGTTVPANALGSNGDYYINTHTGDLYGPKANNAWANIIFNMRGAELTEVIYSNWIVPDSIKFFATDHYYFNVRVPEMRLNPTLKDNAAILVYVKEFGLRLEELGIFQLNHTSLYSFVQLNYAIESDLIKVYFKGTTRLGFANTFNFRYVIIPGNKPSNRSAVVPQSYSQLIRQYNILD